MGQTVVILCQEYLTKYDRTPVSHRAPVPPIPPFPPPTRPSGQPMVQDPCAGGSPVDQPVRSRHANPGRFADLPAGRTTMLVETASPTVLRPQRFAAPHHVGLLARLILYGAAQTAAAPCINADSPVNMGRERARPTTTSAPPARLPRSPIARLPSSALRAMVRWTCSSSTRCRPGPLGAAATRFAPAGGPASCFGIAISAAGNFAADVNGSSSMTVQDVFEFRNGSCNGCN